jgi:hypothetical protein
MLRKMGLFSIGTSSLTQEKVEGFTHEMIKVSRVEGKKIVKEMTQAKQLFPFHERKNLNIINVVMKTKGYQRIMMAMVGIVLGLMLLPTVVVGLPPVRVDDDRDGIDDSLEQFLAERYAPMIYVEPGESNYPVSVDWITQRGNLRYGEQGCTPDENEDFLLPIGSQDRLIGGTLNSPWIHPYSFSDVHHMTHCSSDDARPLSTIEPFPENFGDDQLWFINDFEGRDRIGSLDPSQWATYVHTYPTADGGIMIQYWHTFAFNQFAGADAHGGDWDASIQVQLNSDLDLKGVWFSRHDDDHPGSFFEPSQIRFFEGTHPVVTTDGGGHAAYRSPIDWVICDCTAFSDITGPIGTIVWTRDTDSFDDPEQLRKAEFNCDSELRCSIGLSEPSGGTVWKTWTAGDVRQAGGERHISPNPSNHGGLINVGEYNPAGYRQASRLLDGEFYPLNGQVFIKYSGRWGTTNTLASDGPRGPVFQGFHDGIYTSWYNQGSDTPADPTTSSWREPPLTTLQIGSPTYTETNGATYVKSTTPLTLTATQSGIATQYGSISTFYRFFPVLDLAGSYAMYSVPFGISGVDGTYAVNYFSLDGLNNEEDAKGQVISLDNTPPVASINAPITTQYVHSGILTLNYTVSDVGSGVYQITPKMDGLTLLAGHGLQSGQSINLLTELSVGTHSFTIESKDNVDNSGMESVTFEIIVTAESIMDDVSQFLATGMIKNNGLANSLTAKLDAAAKGDCNTAANIYKAFINELQAQRDKGVDTGAAQIMITDAQYLIAHCQ